LRAFTGPQDKEEAESRLARLQVEHLDLTQRFMEYKAAESARVRPARARVAVRFAACFAVQHACHPSRFCGGADLVANGCVISS